MSVVTLKTKRLSRIRYRCLTLLSLSITWPNIVLAAPAGNRDVVKSLLLSAFGGQWRCSDDFQVWNALDLTTASMRERRSEGGMTLFFQLDWSQGLL